MTGESPLFGYAVPLVGVVLVAVGIGAAVTGGYAALERPGETCGNPTVAVESPERSQRYVDNPRLDLVRLAFEDLAPAERAAFREALSAPVGEAEVRGAFPNARAFTNGTLVAYRGRRYYATVVAENTCFVAPPLQLPLGLLALGLGTIAVLTPPVYRKLVALETEVGWRVSSDSSDPDRETDDGEG